MEKYIPILVVVLSNTVYHICAKSTPPALNPFASLSATYGIAAVVSIVLYGITQNGGSLLGQYQQLNWSSFVLGIAVVGLEAGFLYLYKTGWSVSTGQIVASALLAAVLLFVGVLLYHETITVEKVAGIAVCMAGMYLLNK